MDLRPKRPGKPPALFRLEVGSRTSGGGRAVYRNLDTVRRLFPDVLGIDARSRYTFVPRNWAALPEMASGRFVLMPQNAWAWQGTAQGLRWGSHRAALRIASELSMRRSIGNIRIGRSIPPIGASLGLPLPSVLDLGFDECLTVIASEDRDLRAVEKSFTVIGPFGPYKSLRTVLDAYSLYQRNGGEWELILAGSGSATEGIMLPRVRVIDGPLTRLGVLRRFLRTGAAIFPSTVEASPFTVLEAQALGIPTLLTDIPGHRDVAQFSSYFTPNDAGALAGLMASVEANDVAPDGRLERAVGMQHQRELAREAWAHECAGRLSRSIDAVT